MLLTEKEAREKRCCQAFEPNKEIKQQGTRSFNPLYDAMTFQKCVASRCMAWRWSVDSNRDLDKGYTVFKPQSEWKGFCGLAGRVE